MRPIPALLLLSVAAGLASAEPLDQVLARMDKEAAIFRQMTAKFTRTDFTAVLNDTRQESGVMWMRKSGKKLEMRGEFTGQDARSFGFRDSKGQLFYPKINTVQIYDLGRQRSLLDQFLLLGFGSSGSEIARNYSIKVAGEEAVGGRRTTRIELVPKSQQVMDQIQKVYLWIPDNAGHPVQQQFMQPGGNYNKVVYSDIQINPNLPDSDFQLNLPPGVKKEYPQR